MEYLLAAYWLVAVLALAAAVLPLCARLFPRFPARGAGLAPGVAFALLAVVAYWLGHLHWGTWVALGSTVAVAGVGVLASRGVDRPEVRAVAPALAVFLAAFALFVAVRAVDPAAGPRGGEKFLDYGLLQSIALADRLPPEDIWFAGRPVRYYYGGLLSVGAFADAIGVPVRYAYNLGLATCYAALAAGAYTVGSAVAAYGDRTPDSDRQPESGSARGSLRSPFARSGSAGGAPPALAGVLAAAFVCLAGFPATPIRLLAGAAFAPEFLAEHAEFLVSGLRVDEPFHTGTNLEPWGYWLARYVVEGTITVTPFWSYLNGDLHAHVVAPVFLLPAVGVAFAAWRTPDRRRRLGLLFGALPVFGGALAATSSWSLPTAAGLAFLAVALADVHPAETVSAGYRDRVPATGAAGELARYALAAVAGAAVGLLGAALAAPFFMFHAPVNSGVGVLPPRSVLQPYLLVWGGFATVFAAFLVRRAGGSAARRTAAVAAVVALLYLATLASAGSLAFLAVLLAAAWYLRRTDRAGFAAVLVVAGAGILLATELAYAKVWPHDPNAPRWNTVFKLSMQVAVLWGVAAGVTAAALLEPAIERARSLAGDATRRLSPGDAAGAAVAVLVVLSAMTFPALALANHFTDPPRDYGDATLDASQFVEDHHPHEAAAFEYLRGNADGQPTVLTTAGTETYAWTNAPATFTGYPTVVGWRHERGYRGASAYEDRLQDIQYLFTGDRSTQALLFDRYDVRYVYYGPNERERYPDAAFGGPGVREVYSNPRVTIYRVDADAACAATDYDCEDG